MSATFPKLGPLSVEASASGFGSHVEELHAFFKTRAVEYGSPEDLGLFVDRLDSDPGFRDEIASMLRTVIYRERDGLSWAELMQLLAAAVGGPRVDDATSPEVRGAVRRLMAFVESVFRTRRNPGAVSAAAAVQVVESEFAEPEIEKPEGASVPVAQEAVADSAAESSEAEHPKIDMFYRARMVAEEQASQPAAEERRIELEEPKVEAGAAATEAVLHSDLNWKVPFEHFEDRVTAERGSPAWLWVAGFCALLLAFCAGLFVHQRLIVPLRDANTPYEKLLPEPSEGANPAATTTPAANRAQPIETKDAAANFLVAHPAKGKSSTVAVPASDTNLRPKYLAPATIGASAGLMENRLVYAPPPSYPMVAEMTRIQGIVTVEAVVGKSGRVIRAQAVSGHRLLRGAAVREVYARRYRPYTVNARPVDVATIVTVDFRLRR